MSFFPIILFGVSIITLFVVFAFVFKSRGSSCKTVTPESKIPFCGCSNEASVDDIKFDGTSPVTGFFYQLKSPNEEDGSPAFPDIDVIDLYKNDDRFAGDSRSVTENMVWWMDQKGVSHWVTGREIYSDLINKCYPNENPVTAFVANDNNRHEWTIRLPIHKINEAIDAMYNGTFKYGPSIYRDILGSSGIDDINTWKCCA